MRLLDEDSDESRRNRGTLTGHLDTGRGPAASTFLRWASTIPVVGFRADQTASRVGLRGLVAAYVILLAACAPHPGPTTKGPAAASEKPTPNQIVGFLEGAERQAETDDQRGEILRALEDMRTLDAKALKQRRYADYEGRPEQWTVVVLLQKYFVPRQPTSLDDETAYRDAGTPAAREVIGQQIRALRDGRQVSPVTPN